MSPCQPEVRGVYCAPIYAYVVVQTKVYYLNITVAPRHYYKNLIHNDDYDYTLMPLIVTVNDRECVTNTILLLLPKLLY